MYTTALSPERVGRLREATRNRERQVKGSGERTVKALCCETSA